MTVTLPELSASENITISYAGKLLMLLRQAGLVKAVRGRSGGYILSQPPDKTTLKNIFDALGDTVGGMAHCERYNGGNDDPCVHNEDCSIIGVWDGFAQLIDGFLEKVSLADLANGKIKPVVQSTETMKQNQ